MATIVKRRWETSTGKVSEAWRVPFTDQQGKRRFRQFPTKKEANNYLRTCLRAAKPHQPDQPQIEPMMMLEILRDVQRRVIALESALAKGTPRTGDEA